MCSYHSARAGLKRTILQALVVDVSFPDLVSTAPDPNL